MGLFLSLNREQKQSVGLLSIGTFLEYFDLMLYVHMAVLLNEIFFPKADPHTASLLAAFTFCITFVFRPIGALVFGWMGDHIGRKATIIMTTIIMSISCIVMANLPTYAQIGIAAAWIMTFCRIAQGMSSMGEIMGAQVYLTESIRRPASYPAVASMSVACALGGLVALGVATLVMSLYMNWRLAFWVGAGIALVGAVARTRLRETPDFLKLKDQRTQAVVAELNRDEAENPAKAFQQERPTWKQYVSFKTLMSFFFIHCGYPLCFYLAYIYFTAILRENFGYSSEDIIRHNFLVAFIQVISDVFWTFLSYHIHPLKISKIRGMFSILLMLGLPFLIMDLNSPLQLLFIQALILITAIDAVPAEAALIYHLPIYRRFTYGSFLWALARALIYIITSFGLVYAGGYFGGFGLWFITLPIACAFLYGVLHFEKLERKVGIYPNLS